MAKTKITRPIKVSDVAECLGVSSLDVGSLCTSGNINPWAKYKPVCLADNPIDTPEDWWRADVFDSTNVFNTPTNDCGFEIPRLWTTSAVWVTSTAFWDKFTSDGTNNWKYNRPVGTYWKRLLDFDGYNHLAMQPFSMISDQIYAYEGDESVSVLPAMRNPELEDDSILKIKDFGIAQGQKLYLGAFLKGVINGKTYKSHHVTEYEVTADTLGEINPDRNNNTIPTLPIVDFPAGDYTIYMIIASQPLASNANTILGSYPCPGVPPIKLTIIPKTEPFILTVSYKQPNYVTQIEPSFKLTNNTIHKVKLENVEAKLLIDGDWTKPIENAVSGFPTSFVIKPETTYNSLNDNTNQIGMLLIATSSEPLRVGISLVAVEYNEDGTVYKRTELKATSAILRIPAFGSGAEGFIPMQ